MKKIINILFLSLLLLFVTGCVDRELNVVESMLEHIEGSAKMEDNLLKEKELLELKGEENAIFQEIVSLEIGNKEENERLTNEAIEIAKKRLFLAKEELELLKKAYTEFEKTKIISLELKKEETKKQYKKVSDLMEIRVKKQEDVYNLYVKTTNLDIELYRLLKEEDLNLEEIETQIEKINESYELLKKELDDFNSKTEQYNEERKKLYQLVDLKINIQ